MLRSSIRWSILTCALALMPVCLHAVEPGGAGKFGEPGRLPIAGARPLPKPAQRVAEAPSTTRFRDDRAVPAAYESAPGGFEGGRYPSAPAEPARISGIEDSQRAAPLASAPVDASAITSRSGGRGRPGGAHLEGQQAPALSVQKVAPKEIQVGKLAVFETRVRNVGQTVARNVEVIDELPQGTRLEATNPRAVDGPTGELIWSLGDLKPGEEVAVQMELMPMVEGEIGSIATVHFAAEASARALCTRPALNLAVTAPRDVLIGEEITLLIKISNPGTGVATGVVLSEQVPENLEHPAGSVLEYALGDLQPNETRELELTMKAVKPGVVRNVIRAVADAQLKAEDQTEFEVLAPELEIALEGPKKRYLERQATYRVQISNPGTASAREVRLVTYLPPGMKFVGANNAGEYDPETNTVHWLLEELPADATGEVTWTAIPVEPGEQTVRVLGKAQRGLAVEREESIVVDGVVAILFQIADLSDPVEVGGETEYEIRVVNQGSKAASNVRVVAELPPQMRPIDGDGPTNHQVQGQAIVFEPLTRLAAKADTTFRVRAEALAAGDLRVTARVTSDELTDAVTKEESTRVYSDE